MNNISEILNISLNNNNICFLNQVAMLNGLEKVPINIFIMMTLALTSLICYIYIVPFLKGNVHTIVSKACVIFSASMLIFSSVLLAAITFNINETVWNNILYSMIGLFVIWVIIYTIKNWNKLSKIINEINL